MELKYLTDGRFYQCELCGARFDLLDMLNEPKTLQLHLNRHENITAVVIQDVGLGNLLSDIDAPNELSPIDEEFATNFIGGMKIIANNQSGRAHINMLRADLAKLISCYDYLLEKSSNA